MCESRIRQDSKNAITKAPEYIEQAKEHEFYNGSFFDVSMRLVGVKREESEKPFSFISEESDELTIQNISDFQSTLINN